MGTWHKTCGISGLHIDDNDVLVFVIEKNTIENDRSSSTSLWAPCLLPFYAKYDGYGAGEDNSGIGLPFIINGIKNTFIEKSTELYLVKDEFDIRMFYESTLENKLFKKNKEGCIQPIEFVMVRKDIVDEILGKFYDKPYVNDRFVGEVYFGDVLKDVPEFVNYIMKFPIDNVVCRNIVRGWGNTLVDYYIKTLVDMNFTANSTVNYNEIIISLIKDKKVVELNELITDLLKGIWIHYFMNSIRKQWLPGGFEGSQSKNIQGYTLLANATLAAINNDKENAKTCGIYDDDYYNYYDLDE